MRAKIRLGHLLSFLLLVMALISGCSTFGKGGTSPTVTLQTVQDDYYQAELQAEATDDAFTELTLSPEQDLKQAYYAFLFNAEKMLDRGGPLIEHADGMRFVGPSYLVESAKSTTACPLPGQASTLPTAELRGYFQPIAEDAWEVKRAYRAYQFDLEQIMYYLWDNVTPAAIDNMAQLIAKTEVDGDSLQDALERAQGAIDAAKTAKGEPPAAVVQQAPGRVEQPPTVEQPEVPEQPAIQPGP